VPEGSAHALGDLAGPLYRADRNILACGRSALADGGTGGDGMQRNEIDGTLAGAVVRKNSVPSATRLQAVVTMQTADNLRNAMT
jgi:hypothetical protein